MESLKLYAWTLCVRWSEIAVFRKKLQSMPQKQKICLPEKSMMRNGKSFQISVIAGKLILSRQIFYNTRGLRENKKTK